MSPFAATPRSLRLWSLALSLLLGCTVSMEAPPDSTSGGRAALLVVHGEGRVVTRCVDFEPGAGVFELVESSGLPFTTEYFPALNSQALCSIDGEGCDHPQEPCLCQPSYWSLWLRQEGAWVTSNEGPSQVPAKNGELYGWVWGNGTTPPPEVSVEEICTE